MERLSDILFFVFSVGVYLLVKDLGIASNILAVIALVAILQFFAILIHEIGHAVVAHWRGAILLDLVAFPIGYNFAAERYYGTMALRGTDIGGFVNYEFPEGRGTRLDEGLIYAAGPVANFLLAAVLAAILFVVSAEDEPDVALAPPPIVLLEAEDHTAPAGTAILPDNESLDKIFEEARAQAFAERRARFLYGVAYALAIISAGLGLLNLIPTQGSDGAGILDSLIGR